MERLIETLICKLFRNRMISIEQKEIYAYGATLIVTTSMGFISILLVSILFFSVFDGILFLTVFSSIRVCAGGYHCKTYFACFLVSNAIFLTVMIIAWALSFLPTMVILVLNSLLILFSWLYIVLQAPVLPTNHSLSEKKIQKNRAKARAYSSTITLLGMGSILLFRHSNIALHYFTILALTQTTIAGLMQFEKTDQLIKVKP